MIPISFNAKRFFEQVFILSQKFIYFTPHCFLFHSEHVVVAIAIIVGVVVAAVVVVDVAVVVAVVVVDVDVVVVVVVIVTDFFDTMHQDSKQHLRKNGDKSRKSKF